MASGIVVNDGAFEDAMRLQMEAVERATQEFVRQGGEVIAGNAR